MNKPSVFSKVPAAEPNQIFNTVNSYSESTNPNKMNLSIGSIYNDEGELVELSSVKKAEKESFDENLDKEYPPLSGLPAFNDAIQNLFFPADSKVVTEGRIAVFQTITGGMSLRLTGEIIAKFFDNKKIHISQEHFESYDKIFVSIAIEYYPYYHKTEKRIDIEGILAYLNKIEESSFVLLQVSSHNPTALDFTESEWDSVIDVLKAKKHIAIFDVAYLGYGTGSVSGDLYPVYKAASLMVEMLVCYSSAKNFCNYCDDIGAIIIVFNRPETLLPLKTHLIVLCRSMFSFSTLYGSRIIVKILNQPELKKLWHEEQDIILNRIKLIRESLINELTANKAKVNLEFLKSQRGLYAFLDLTPEQTEYLTKNFGIFVCEGGRINLSAVTRNQINYLAQSIKETLEKA